MIISVTERKLKAENKGTAICSARLLVLKLINIPTIIEIIETKIVYSWLVWIWSIWNAKNAIIEQYKIAQTIEKRIFVA